MDAEQRAVYQRTAGLPDDSFVTDGLLTKRAVRAVALAMLAPMGAETLWDLGAGSGSISIEWCLQDFLNTAIAVEHNPKRVELIAQNSSAFGVESQLRTVVGDASDVLGQLAPPDAIFVGGGITTSLLETCWDKLPDAGRLVVHSVTADSDAHLLRAYRTWGGDLHRISVETAEPIGRYVGFRPARTVTTWGATKS